MERAPWSFSNLSDPKRRTIASIETLGKYQWVWTRRWICCFSFIYILRSYWPCNLIWIGMFGVLTSIYLLRNIYWSNAELNSFVVSTFVLFFFQSLRRIEYKLVIWFMNFFSYFTNNQWNIKDTYLVAKIFISRYKSQTSRSQLCKQLTGKLFLFDWEISSSSLYINELM